MNQYGRRAQRYWQQHLPSQYAQIEDPTAFFDEMGQTLAQQIEDLAEAIARRSPSTQDFMANLGRLNRAKDEAEIEVFREMLPQPESASPNEDDPADA
ncbi:hypothetical protein [Micromonospora sp. NPDC049662]|uniref:hypothetical protein n=1 Tax=Micromonospora sp. NPDC049662 TaxID=3155397 RepID=UPI003412BB5F